MRLAALACRAFGTRRAPRRCRTSTRRAACGWSTSRRRRSPLREAVARGRIRMSAAALRQIRAGNVKKGDPLQTARLAGIMAAKQTSALIPLCHPLPLSHVDVELTPRARRIRHREPRANHGADRRRDGSADGRRRRGAHRLRHGQGRRQGDGHRRHPPRRKTRRKEREYIARARR